MEQKMDNLEQMVFNLYRDFITGEIKKEMLLEAQKMLSNSIIASRILNCTPIKETLVYEEFLWLKNQFYLSEIK